MFVVIVNREPVIIKDRELEEEMVRERKVMDDINNYFKWEIIDNLSHFPSIYRLDYYLFSLFKKGRERSVFYGDRIMNGKLDFSAYA